MANTDFDIPKGLSRDARKVAQAIVRKVKQNYKDASGGGCRAFYTPKEWKERGEDYGTESILIVVHDGGDLAPYFNWDYCAYDLREAMDEVVRASAKGAWVEQCTSWYSAIYQD